MYGNEAVELSDDEDKCSTASSSEENDGEDVAPRTLCRSARLEAQMQPRTSAAARTPPLRTPPSSSGAACCVDSGADSDANSGTDGDEDSDADRSQALARGTPVFSPTVVVAAKILAVVAVALVAAAPCL